MRGDLGDEPLLKRLPLEAEVFDDADGHTERPPLPGRIEYQLAIAPRRRRRPCHRAHGRVDAHLLASGAPVPDPDAGCRAVYGSALDVTGVFDRGGL